MVDARKLPRNVRRAIAVELEKENAKRSACLELVPEDQWGETSRKMTRPPVEIWRSSSYLVQIYAERTGLARMSVCRTTIKKSGDWDESISWDDLQRLKRECGRGDFDALEIYPADKDVVNVANIRHLWILTSSKIDFAWRKKNEVGP